MSFVLCKQAEEMNYYDNNIHERQEYEFELLVYETIEDKMKYIEQDISNLTIKDESYTPLNKILMNHIVLFTETIKNKIKFMYVLFDPRCNIDFNKREESKSQVEILEINEQFLQVIDQATLISKPYKRIKGSGTTFTSGDIQYKFARVEKPHNKIILYQNVTLKILKDLPQQFQKKQYMKLIIESLEKENLIEKFNKEQFEILLSQQINELNSNLNWVKYSAELLLKLD